MPDVTRGSQPKAIGSLVVHVATIGCTRLSVHTEVAFIGPNLTKEWREGIGWWSQHCHHSPKACCLGEIDCLVPTMTVVTYVLLDKVWMRALGS